jgi:Fe2+ transport system protein FeoA
VGGPAEIRERLRDLGFVEGEQVRMVKTAPLADPSEYCVQGIDVGLRRREAELIEVRDATGGRDDP